MMSKPKQYNLLVFVESVPICKKKHIGNAINLLRLWDELKIELFMRRERKGNFSYTSKTYVLIKI